MRLLRILDKIFLQRDSISWFHSKKIDLEKKMFRAEYAKACAHIGIEDAPKLYCVDASMAVWHGFDRIPMAWFDSEYRTIFYIFGRSNAHLMNRGLFQEARVSMAETAYHELVHAMQFDRGDLKFDEKTNCSMWHGKAIASYGHLHWEERPWEIEAIELSMKYCETVYPNDVNF